MTDLTYHVDGTLVPAEEATVNVRDRGFMYGDAAFETLRVYGGDVFEWDAHFERLARTCAVLDFDEAMPPADDLRERVVDTVAANDFTDAYAKVSISRGVQPGTLTPEPRVAPTITVVVSELPRGGTEGESVWDDPATVTTVETRKIPSAALPASVKSHNYLNGILARLELQSMDDTYDEALLRDFDDYVTEGAASNVFLVDNGTVKTPTAAQDLLPGITRGVVLDIAHEEGFPVEDGRYAPSDLRAADELFVTNSTWELRPVTHVDGVDIEVGPMTRLLAKLFDERVERQYYG